MWKQPTSNFHLLIINEERAAPNDVPSGNVPPMRKSRALSMSAAVAAMSLSLTPGVAVAKPADKRGSSSVVAFPLLALHMDEHATSPFSHYSHSSHVSHSSHYSGSHNSHSSHYSHSSHSSHYSSSPTVPPPPPPTSTQPAPSPSSARPKSAGHSSHHHVSAPSPSPSASQSSSQSPSPTPSDSTISPQPASHDSASDDAGVWVIVGLTALGAGGTYFIYRRNTR